MPRSRVERLLPLNVHRRKILKLTQDKCKHRDFNLGGHEKPLSSNHPTTCWLARQNVCGDRDELRPCLVPNKSPTYKSKSAKSDLFCQTDPTYKSPPLISHKLLHPNLKLISHPLLHVSHHLYIKTRWEGVLR